MSLSLKRKSSGKMAEKVLTAYKFVGKDLVNHGHRWKIGEWSCLDNKEPLELCKNGFHASKQPIDVLEYTENGTRLFIVEARGKLLFDEDKFCSSEMRLVKEVDVKVLHWFAIACARHVLHIYEKRYPKDKRPSEAIQAAEDYLNGRITLKELKAKEYAAWDAWAAARDAAWDAEREWQNNTLKRFLQRS